MAKQPGTKSRTTRTHKAPRAAALTAPDHAEERYATELDNIVPSSNHSAIPIVGLGASAGGITAMRDFFGAMPADSGMAFVVVLHLAAEQESMLASVIQPVTAMPVTQVEGEARVESNHVYVIPPGKSIVSTDGFLRLEQLPPDRSRRMTVDTFFRTLADSHGARAAAIVLSGADGDGAIGIKRIKECGGLTVVQDPEEAEYPGMPRTAIATGMVDWVLPAADIPARLVQYGMFEHRLKLPPEEGALPATPAAATRDDNEIALREVLGFLRTRTSRNFSYYKRATILRRIARRMQVNGVEDLPSYLLFLRTHAGEAVALLQDLLISVTNFFRDQHAFEALDEHLAQLIALKGPNDTLRVWVPACATGEEAYSIAMLLSDRTRTLESPPLIQIFATDLNDEAIQVARGAVFPETIVADVSEERLRRFFARERGVYRIRREIREMVMFATHDLLADSPFSRLDLISCRNLLIYLDRTAQKRICDIFSFSLNTGGILFLGQSESMEEESAFGVLDKKHRIYIHRGTHKPGLPVMAGPSSLAVALRAPVRHPPVLPGPAFRAPDESLQAAAALPATHSWAGIHSMLVDWLAPPSILVNADHEIVHLSEKAGQYLRFRGGEPSRNLLHTAHPMLRVELRAALYRAAQTKAPQEVPVVPIDLDGLSRNVSIKVIPADELADGFLLVTFDAHTSPLARSAPDGGEPVDETDSRLARELERMQEQLRNTIEQHDTSTEELKASNEELQAMNEELRSATEELETSREELQSINEELTTVNQELKASVDELGNSNSDLHNLMASTAIATIFLDRGLRISRYTPSAVELFNLIPTDIGRPLSDLTHRLDYPGLEHDAERVLANLVPIEREVGRGGARWFLARTLPYRTVDDRIAGLVLTFVDVTELRNAREALRSSEDRYLNLFTSIDEGVAVLENVVDADGTPDFRFIEVNPAFAPQTGLANVAGKNLSEVLPVLEPEWMQRFLQALEQGDQVRFEAGIAALGRSFDVFVSRIGAPGSARIGVMLSDVTARKTSQRELTLAKEDLEMRVGERTRELSASHLRMLTEVSTRIKLEEGRARLLLDFASAQEEERNRVARDLHDSLGQHLAVLAMNLKNIELSESCAADIRPRIAQMQATTQRLDEEIDRLSQALRPLALSDHGLEAALRSHVEAWSRETGIAGDVQMRGMEGQRFSFIVETTVYRVVQEALTNVVKHARAQHVSLVTERLPRDLRVIVEDDGKGFDPEGMASGKQPGKLGLRGMRERAALIGGDLQIESAPGRGTTVFLTVPLIGAPPPGGGSTSVSALTDPAPDVGGF